MELKTENGKYIISKEEYEFLVETKRTIQNIKNNWFSEGRRFDHLVKMAEKLTK